MHITIPKADLLRLISRAAGVADAKSTMTALGCVLLDASEKMLTAAATNLYMSVRSSAACDTKLAGKVAISAKDLLDRVKLLPDGPVEIKHNDGDALRSVTLRSVTTKRRYTLHALSADDYPPLPAAPKTEPTPLPLSTIYELIRRTHFAVSTDETRPNLNSALLQLDGKAIRMVATDGHRLALAEREHAQKDTATMLLSRAAIEVLRRLEADFAAESEAEQPEVDIQVGGTSVFFRAGSLSFSCKLVDATFPPYNQVIPENSDRAIRIPRAPFLDAIKAVSIAARDSAIRLILAPSTLRLMCSGPESGDGVDELAIEYEGREVTIGFNARYLVEALSALDCEEIVLKCGGELDIALIEQADDTGFKAAVMPCRV